ncbi:MAG: N-acetylneuraminate synthase [Thaumarchaeota archaeon]|nr:MAG: N-acetylneuraminate synthase [Nitrososphaerota archaeon]
MVFITGEIGINHNGDVSIAKQLIDVAKKAGCNAVKFQKRTIDKVYSKEILDSPRESIWGTTTREQKLGLEFEKNEYDQIDSYCKKLGIEWFASSWNIESQLFLRQYDLSHNKIASAMLTNHELLNVVAEEEKHTFIATGMSTIEEISKAIKIFENNNCPFELMHTNSSYPMKLEEANLKCITTLQNQFHCDVGYSGHEVDSYTCCIISAVLGATSIERHITLSRALPGSDQSASLEPSGLERMVRDVRRVESVLGDGIKRIWDSEVPVMKKLRTF